MPFHPARAKTIAAVALTTVTVMATMGAAHGATWSGGVVDRGQLTDHPDRQAGRVGGADPVGDITTVGGPDAEVRGTADLEKTTSSYSQEDFGTDLDRYWYLSAAVADDVADDSAVDHIDLSLTASYLNPAGASASVTVADTMVMDDQFGWFPDHPVTELPHVAVQSTTATGAGDCYVVLSTSDRYGMFSSSLVDPGYTAFVGAGCFEGAANVHATLTVTAVSAAGSASATDTATYNLVSPATSTLRTTSKTDSTGGRGAPVSMTGLSTTYRPATKDVLVTIRPKRLSTKPKDYRQTYTLAEQYYGLTGKLDEEGDPETKDAENVFAQITPKKGKAKGHVTTYGGCGKVTSKVVKGKRPVIQIVAPVACFKGKMLALVVRAEAKKGKKKVAPSWIATAEGSAIQLF